MRTDRYNARKQASATFSSCAVDNASKTCFIQGMEVASWFSSHATSARSPFQTRGKATECRKSWTLNTVRRPTMPRRELKRRCVHENSLTLPLPPLTTWSLGGGGRGGQSIQPGAGQSSASWSSGFSARMRSLGSTLMTSRYVQWSQKQR